VVFAAMVEVATKVPIPIRMPITTTSRNEQFFFFWKRILGSPQKLSIV